MGKQQIQTVEYVAWCNMRWACTKPHHERYALTGAYGIMYDLRWNDFKDFLADVGPNPSKEYHLTRVNRTKDFTPENTRWELINESHDRTIVPKKYEYNGQEYTLTELADSANLDSRISNRRRFLQQRLWLGMSVQEAVEKPFWIRIKRGPYKDINDIECTCGRTSEPDPLKHCSHSGYRTVNGERIYLSQCRKFSIAYQRMRREKAKQNG